MDLSNLEFKIPQPPVKKTTGEQSVVVTALKAQIEDLQEDIKVGSKQ